ncbi:MAG: cobalamin-binding protein [Candidatus Omnitrophica bacterium]|nr:cobalamin-binding protein [Candidatus Omnitrophota bacterium]
MKRFKKIAGLFIIFFLLCGPAYCRDIRVISLAPSTTEILFSLGLSENEIVGITNYCNYPPQTRNIPKVGSLATVNIEKIISLKPDYVFSVGSASNPLNKSLKAAGLDVKIFNAERLDGIFLAILDIGEITGRKDKAETLVKNMRRELQEIRDKTKSIEQPKKVYVEIWGEPITSCGRNSLVDEVITAAGGINIAGSINTLYPLLSQEFIISQDPDVILLGYMSRDQAGLKKAVASRFGWQNIKAVKNDQVICDISPDIFLRPGPRIVDGIAQIQKRLYGE